MMLPSTRRRCKSVRKIKDACAADRAAARKRGVRVDMPRRESKMPLLILRGDAIGAIRLFYYAYAAALPAALIDVCYAVYARRAYAYIRRHDADIVYIFAAAMF